MKKVKHETIPIELTGETMKSCIAISALLSILVFGAILACGMEGGKAGTVIRESVSGQQLKDAPAAPSNLKASLAPTGVMLEWRLSPTDPGTVTGYEIVRSTAISGPFVAVGSVDKGVREFVDTTASPENIYFYKVRAVSKEVYSPFSREAVVEVPGRLSN